MTSLIDSELFQGLPNAGSHIGGSLKGLAPGIGSIILIPKIASGIGAIPGAIAKSISKGKYKTRSYKVPLITKTIPW